MDNKEKKKGSLHVESIDTLDLASKVVRGIWREGNSDLEQEEFKKYKELAEQLPEWGKEKLEKLLKFFNEDGSFKADRVSPLEVTEPNLIRHPEKYNTSTDDFINKLALHDPSNIEIKHKGEKLITGLFIIDDIEGLPPHLTNENLMFLEGAFNLYMNGITTFSPEVLYRYAVGRPTARVTDHQRERAIASIERMATVRQELNITPYIKKYGSKDAKARLEEDPDYSYLITSYMLPIESVSERVQGVTQRVVYKMIQAPALLKYNELLENKRIGQIDKELLTPLNTSVEESLIKLYLVKRLLALENPNNRMSNPVISFETLYKHIDVKEPNKWKRKKIREDVCAVLDYWKSIKRIRGYELVGTRPITGVELNYIKRKKSIK